MNGAQIHMLSNHLPVLGTAFAAALTLAGIWRGSEDLKKAGLWAFVLAALSALPAYFSGEGAEEIVEHLSGVTEKMIKPHEEAAEKALIAVLLLGATALGALIHAFKKKVLHPMAAQAVLALSLPVIAALVYVAHLGGLVHHPEMNFSATPAADTKGQDKDNKDG